MILSSVDDSPILDLPAVSKALVHLYGKAPVAAPRYGETPLTEVSVDVNPPGEPPFTVALGKSRSGVSIDGTFYQNERVAAALRAVIGADAPRIVVFEPKRGAFAELPAGVRAEQVALGWRDYLEYDENEPGGDPGRRVPAPTAPRSGWAASSFAPRPQAGATFRLDLARHPQAVATPQPGARYEVSLPGGIEADYCTDPGGRARYFETVPGSVPAPNPVLAVPQPGATYVVHPFDGRYTTVLYTDDQARVVQAAAERVAPVRTYGLDAHPLAALLGAWPGQVSPHALLTGGSAADDGLAALAWRLIDTMHHGGRVTVRLQASYPDPGAVPSGFQAEYTIDGQTTTETFADV